MSESTTQPAAPAPQKSNKSTIVIVIMALVIIVQAVYLFLIIPKERQELKTEIASTESLFSSTLLKLKYI